MATRGIKPNAQENRESWLQSAIAKLRDDFARHTLPGNSPILVPPNIRAAIGFPSTGKRGKRLGETWAPGSSADGHYEIFLRADLADGLAVLSALSKELVHASLPTDAGHGKLFRDAAMIVGLRPPMRAPALSPELQKRLEEIAEELGPLPHGELDLNGDPVVAVSPIPLNRPKKQTTRQLKATCPECVRAGGDYKCRIAGSYVKDPGPPLCPKHKCALDVEWPQEMTHTDERQQSFEDAEGL